MAKRPNSNGSPDHLLRTHAALDMRVKELDRRVSLTPAEQIELAQLKKRKLVLKDQIRASQPPPEPVT